LLDLQLHNLGSFRHRFSSDHLFLHEPQALIFLMEACQFVFDYCFDLLIQILLLVLLSFSLFVLSWLPSVWSGVVQDRHLRLSC
jgi:hypothetical protein